MTRCERCGVEFVPGFRSVPVDKVEEWGEPIPHADARCAERLVEKLREVTRERDEHIRDYLDEQRSAAATRAKLKTAREALEAVEEDAQIMKLHIPESCESMRLGIEVVAHQALVSIGAKS